MEIERVSDSLMIGTKKLSTELSEHEKNLISEDIHKYAGRKGIGDYTTIEFQPIVKAVSHGWEILGGESPVRSFELLGRFRVRGGPNADKFIGAIYSAWNEKGKNDYCSSNLKMRKNCPFPSVNLNILPSYWEKMLGDSDVLDHFITSTTDSDFPEVQEFDTSGRPILGPHSNQTIEAIKLFCSKTGRRVSIDDWNLEEVYCNNTEFVDAMVALNCVCEVKVDIKLCLALFGIELTASQSPDWEYLNKAAAKLVEGSSREALRQAALPCWKRWTDAGVFLTLEASPRQEHLDSWPQLKDSGIDTSRLFMQGSEFGAKTFTQEAIESVSAHPTFRIGCSCS